jgi:ABC-type transporter Mla subunit MlaD
MAESYRGDEIKAGATILVSLLVLVGIIVVVSRGDFRATAAQYRIEFRAVGALEEGAQVRLGGVRVGRVLRIVPPVQETPRVQVFIGLRKGIVLREGTEATVATLGLLGDNYIELSNPRPGPREIPPGSLIASRGQATMGELFQNAQELAETAKGLIARVQAFVDGPLDEAVRRTSQAMGTGDRVLRGVEETLTPATRENLRKAVAEAAAILEENRVPLREAVADMRALIRRVDALAAEGSGLIRRVDSAAAAGETLLRKLDEAVDEKGGDLKGTIAAMKTDLELAKNVLEELDRILKVVDRALAMNPRAVEEILSNLRDAARNARELTQKLKERPWLVIFPESSRDRDGAR